MVLRPNKGAASCSLALDYTTPLDQKLPALLVIEFANPRILALFRCFATFEIQSRMSQDTKL